jgi:hypothetical protein
MPRIYICIKDYHAEEHDGDCCMPYDFCKKCIKALEAEEVLEVLRKDGYKRITLESLEEQIEDARETDFGHDHPPYNDDPDFYHCAICDEELTEDDY